jgi:hypothetical protein
MCVVLPMLHTRLSQKSKLNGAPTLLFVAGAALRVADATRILKDNRLRREKGADVAKLFARHFKLEEHVSYLKRSKIGSAVGTPGRIGKLLCETGEPRYDIENRLGLKLAQMLSRCLNSPTLSWMYHTETQRKEACLISQKLGTRYLRPSSGRRKYWRASAREKSN